MTYIFDFQKLNHYFYLQKPEGEDINSYLVRCSERVLPAQKMKALLGLCTVPNFDFNTKDPDQVDSAFKTILEDSVSNSRALEDSKIISFVAHFKGAADEKHLRNFLDRLQDQNLKLRILEEWANHCYRLAFVSKRVGNQALRTAQKNKTKTDHAYEIL